jgi:hypothetical protein
MEGTTIDRAAMGRLAKALVFVCGPDHPTTIALQAAAESGSERDIKNARPGQRHRDADGRRLDGSGCVRWIRGPPLDGQRPITKSTRGGGPLREQDQECSQRWGPTSASSVS